MCREDKIVDGIFFFSCTTRVDHRQATMLCNQYFALRHGLSIPNIKKIIVSTPEHGTAIGNGLSPEGVLQAEQLDLSVLLKDDRPLVIVSSDFTRALQTALIIHSRLSQLQPLQQDNKMLHQDHQTLQPLHPDHQTLHHDNQTLHQYHQTLQPLRDHCAQVQPKLVTSEQLRERNFGELEHTSNENYEKVWKEDELDPNHQEFQVESVSSVATRVQKLIDTLEQDYKGHKVILVSHGDTLQILQAQVFSHGKVAISQHRYLPHLNTCELRALN